ncbi:hypothetical protein [Streptacidiphilus jiangxiensis]|uniref:Uncharacterized protein n=1 Tax=Streptacidiphilus jiangxiensis TaxID=235985 RepID=A0A1H7X0B3_STRJI|nr:hypothetical protein [Streptacidiphilus jiangxiensis]SEM27326.1 hypothetical protein SAMN05414137_12255 [Streptacidiphilus jiangxiensis]
MNRLQAWARGTAYFFGRHPLLRRAWPPVALVVAAVSMYRWGLHRQYTVPGVVVATSALPLIAVAASWPVWRASAETRALSGPVRWRRLQRRICWRIGFLLLIAAAVAVVVIGYAYQSAWESGAAMPSALQTRAEVVAACLAVAAPLPVALDPLLWLAWTVRVPAVRRVVRADWVATQLQEDGRFRGYRDQDVPQPGYEPDLGWSGRPLPVLHNEPPYQRGEPVTVRVAPFRPDPWHPKPSRLEAARLEHVSVSWDGTAFVFTGRRERLLRVPAENVAEVVHVHESNRSMAWNRLMLLDSRGRRVATMHSAYGFEPAELCALVTAAGLPFAQYHLGETTTVLTLKGRLFPLARGHVRISGA